MEAHRHIEAVGDDVAKPVAVDQFQLQLGMRGQEAAELGTEHQPRKVRIDTHPQAPADDAGALARIACRLLQPGQQRQHPFVQPAALVSK